MLGSLMWAGELVTELKASEGHHFGELELRFVFLLRHSSSALLFYPET